MSSNGFNEKQSNTHMGKNTFAEPTPPKKRYFLMKRNSHHSHPFLCIVMQDSPFLIQNIMQEIIQRTKDFKARQSLLCAEKTFRSGIEHQQKRELNQIPFVRTFKVIECTYKNKQTELEAEYVTEAEKVYNKCRGDFVREANRLFYSNYERENGVCYHEPVPDGEVEKHWPLQKRCRICMRRKFKNTCHSEKQCPRMVGLRPREPWIFCVNACFICNKPGHWRDECEMKAVEESGEKRRKRTVFDMNKKNNAEDATAEREDEGETSPPKKVYVMDAALHARSEADEQSEDDEDALIRLEELCDAEGIIDEQVAPVSSGQRGTKTKFTRKEPEGSRIEGTHKEPEEDKTSTQHSE